MAHQQGIVLLMEQLQDSGEYVQVIIGSDLEWKLCSVCNVLQPLSNFHKDRTSKRNRTKVRSDCKTCRRVRTKDYYQRRKDHILNYAHTHTELRRKNTLKYEYNITPAQYADLLSKQNGVCAICKNPERRRNSKNLCVDHDHQTGRIRGLLCHTCNSGIGKLNDDPALLRTAMVYLETI